MSSLLKTRFMTDMIRTASDLYAHGWDERNGGNISLMLEPGEADGFSERLPEERIIPTGFSVPGLDGREFLVTAAGKYFRNVSRFPEECLGIVRLEDGGMNARVLWGFEGGGTPTSEFSAHAMSHAARMETDPENRVVIHSHPTDLIAMTFVHELDERSFTRTLWQMCTECVVVFPDGVGIIPWILCGTNEIGEATAEKMRTSRIVVWPHHGIYAAGRTLDGTFGLIETAEKAAEVYLKIAGLKIMQRITDGQMHQLEERFGFKAKEGYLD